HHLMDEVYELFQRDVQTEDNIRERLHNPSGKRLNILLDPQDRKNIFSLEEIHPVCVQYRLRFLDSSLYKNDFPYEAITRIKAFEKKYDVKIEKFKIMAPSRAFNLESINRDPVLLAELSNNRYYFIHKWGNDMAWYKKYLYAPVQTPVIFFITMLVLCAAMSIALPSAWMNVLNFTSAVYLKIWLSLHLFIMFSGIAIWAGMAFDKNFSCYIWDSKYYNN